MTERLRCRAAVWERNWPRSYQCPNPAKTTRALGYESKTDVPVCGVHARTQVPDIYSKFSGDRYAGEPQEFMA